MSKKFSLLLAIVLISSLILSACQPAATEPAAPVDPTPVEEIAEPTATEAMPEPTATEAMPEATATEAMAEATATEPAAQATDMSVCQVTDVGGIDDRSFNATAWRGAERAQDELGFEAKYLESQQQTDYEKNINAFIEEQCSLIVTVGFLLGDATQVAAQANPDQNFAIVDFAYDPALDNVLGLVFATDQAAFLAGYLAAGMTQTGIVGTFGGIQIPPVTVFMDGFALGVDYYNEENGTSVEVLGWDPATQQGLFTGNFESTDDGRTLGETLLGEGADIIMPVAGPVGLGTAEAVQTAGNAWIIGVDDDWAIRNSQYADVTLTSVTKNMDISVFEASEAVADGTFQGGLFVGTLENDGVGLGTIADVVPAELLAQVEEVRAAVVAGTLKTSPAQ